MIFLALLVGTAYLVVGQMAVYLVDRELSNRERQLAFPAHEDREDRVLPEAIKSRSARSFSGRCWPIKMKLKPRG